MERPFKGDDFDLLESFGAVRVPFSFPAVFWWDALPPTAI